MGDFHVLAIRIKELRSVLKMTQKQFAEKVGCTAATLSAYENGSKSPSLEIVRNIAEKCNVSIDWLVGLTDNESKDKEITNCSDIIELLFKIEAATKVRIEEITYEGSVMNYNIGYPEPIVMTAKCLVFEHVGLGNFLAEWEKMKVIYENGTIDREVFSLWVEKTLTKYKSVGLGSGFIDLPESEDN